jgi:hypothetical protein
MKRTQQALLILALVLPGEALARSQPIAIDADRVLDGKGGVITNATIIVEDVRIVKIDSAPSEETPPVKLVLQITVDRPLSSISISARERSRAPRPTPWVAR